MKILHVVPSFAPCFAHGGYKIKALVDCDVFAMPSRYESFTTSGLEAMACFKPAVQTKKQPYTELGKRQCRPYLRIRRR